MFQVVLLPYVEGTRTVLVQSHGWMSCQEFRRKYPDISRIDGVIIKAHRDWLPQLVGIVDSAQSARFVVTREGPTPPSRPTIFRARFVGRIAAKLYSRLSSQVLLQQ